MADTLATTLTELLAPVAEREGLYLEGIQTTKAGKYSTVRVLVDLPDGPGDLDLDTLAEATRAVSEVMDEADPVKGGYTLEVSTPGAERPLITPRHFRRAVGHDAEVTAGGQVLIGTVTQAGEGTFTLSVEGTEHEVAVEDVESARMVVLF